AHHGDGQRHSRGQGFACVVHRPQGHRARRGRANERAQGRNRVHGSRVLPCWDKFGQRQESGLLHKLQKVSVIAFIQEESNLATHDRCPQLLLLDRRSPHVGTSSPTITQATRPRFTFSRFVRPS